MAADGLPGGPSDEQSDGWLREAEATAAARLTASPPEERPQVALWRDAYSAFGAKPTADSEQPRGAAAPGP